jgi:hypothetical protein
MAADDETTGGKRYTMGNIGAGARVVQGDQNTWIEAVQGAPGGQELQRQLEELLARIAKAPDLDEDSRQLATEKTRAVADALAQAGQSPDGLRRALRDARVFLTSTAGWAWEGLRKALSSEAAQHIISGITEGATRAAIQGLLGVSAS